MSDHDNPQGGKQAAADGNQPGVLRDEEIDQFASFFLLAAQLEPFQKRLQDVLDMPETDGMLKDAKRDAFRTLLTDYGMIDTDDRYLAMMDLNLNDDLKGHGNILKKVRAFALAFGHKNIGTFN